MWRNNIVATAGGQPAFIDPAPYYAWAEVDLSMLLGCGRVFGQRVPGRFLEAYTAMHPVEDGLASRLEILFLRELLSGIAHFGDAVGPAVIEVVASTVHAYG